ncbi:MAG: hypothetical protein FP816_09950 [Desulfobacteraceae bacterium]|nr:hypothetical protein [Desulfobacteraceae bacterium]MBU4001922.1 hypothetical protein [Pseudomonadota bacterium]MBU4053944.1 hypothetical protein [Pseudomonadota bacterium]
MRSFILTPAAGKRLIAKAVATHPDITGVLKSGTLVIVAGTTNALVAEEILKSLNQTGDFSGNRFFRGITLPPEAETTEAAKAPDTTPFPGDVIITDGVFQKGKTIFDVVDRLKKGDMILKGANAVDLVENRAAILIGHPSAGTIGAAIQAVIGRRVRLMLPVGLEKRVSGNLDKLAEKVNRPEGIGPRLFPVPGEIITELEAVTLLTGAKAELIAAGGVGGAEGCVWLGIEGSSEQMEKASALMKSVAKEPAFKL